MPGEKIVLPITSAPAPEASAVLFSILTYPDQVDATKREQFRIALCRWAILKRAEIEKQWGGSVQQLKPEVFSQGEKNYLGRHKRGSKVFMQRVKCSSLMVMPHLSTPPKRFEGFVPTVNNMAIVIKRALGWGENAESESTVKSKIWAPAKPVAHAAVALSMSIMAIAQTEEETGQGWDGDHALCRSEPFLAIMFYPDLLRMLLEEAEKLRLRLPDIGSFRIKESDTVQFIGD
jgi:hypothetical protein